MEATAGRPEAIIRRIGFRRLGEITLGPDLRLRFPRPPECGGLYFIAFHSGGYYVGETGLYAGTGRVAGRFNHYAGPKDDVWTELVINSMLRAGGYIYIREEPLADERQRRRIEAAVVKIFVTEEIPLWNDGGGRCERTYLGWKIPIMERMLTSALARYADREILSPYARMRLRKLPLALEKARAEAQRLGLALHPHRQAAARPKVLVSATRRNGPSSRTSPPVSTPHTALIEPEVIALQPPVAAMETREAIAHRFLAIHRDATLEDLRRGLPETFNPSTVRTLWNDYQMTRKAMLPGEYTPGEDKTLTIRRVACRLWDAHAGRVTKEMVETELDRQGFVRDRKTVRAIAGNTIGTLEAFSGALISNRLAT